MIFAQITIQHQISFKLEFMAPIRINTIVKQADTVMLHKKCAKCHYE